MVFHGKYSLQNDTNDTPSMYVVRWLYVNYHFSYFISQNNRYKGRKLTKIIKMLLLMQKYIKNFILFFWIWISLVYRERLHIASLFVCLFVFSRCNSAFSQYNCSLKTIFRFVSLGNLVSHSSFMKQFLYQQLAYISTEGKQYILLVLLVCKRYDIWL